MTKPKPYPTITVKQLRDALNGHPDHYTIDFGGLKFLRIKPRAPTHLQVEWAQSVYLDDAGNVEVHNHN